MSTRRALPPPPAKGRKRTPLERRAKALQDTQAKFGLKRFSFRSERDCARMVGFHLSRLGRRLQVSPARYTDAAGAKAALEALGFADLPALLDSRLERIPFARALVGDIVQLPAEEGPFAEIGALGIYQGQGAVFAYHEDEGRPVVLKLLVDPLAVWSAL